MWEKVGRALAGRRLGRRTISLYRRSLHALASLSANHPNDVRHRPADNHSYHLHDAAQAVAAMKVRSRDARRYPHSVHLRRDAEQAGREVSVR